jgi:photosystem II stability/assembly factor-like uncharacterized protein
MSAFSLKRWRSRAPLAFLAAVLLILSTSAVTFASTSSPGSVTLLKISHDPFTNSGSQHHTQVEPDTYSHGKAVVSVFQSGRFYGGGSSDIGWATSHDNGKTWKHGFLPDTTLYSTPPGPYAAVSDASIAFDAKAKVWIVSYLALTNGNEVDVLDSRSTDGGYTWSNPFAVNKSGDFNDKNWSVCDDSASSPYYGNCYTEFDDNSLGDYEQMSTSTDGGKTWSAAQNPGGNTFGLGGQPVVQPNGTVIVPYEDLSGTESAFTSTNGGSSWNAPVVISTIDAYFESAPIRTSPLPSAEIDGAGNVYVAWQDCRFEPNCDANDIVFSTSSNGTSWSAVQRVPADPIGSNVDHFIPGIAVDKATSGSSAHIAVTYYYFTQANCTSNCNLDVGYISSTNGGSTWSASQQLAGPMQLTWLANTNQGYMVGDYISTSITKNGNATGVFAVAHAPKGSTLNEAMFTVAGGMPVTGGSNSSHARVLNQRNAALRFNRTAY